MIALQTVIRARRRVEPAANAPPAAGYLTGLRTLLRNTNLMILALVSGIRSFTQQGLQSFLPLYLVNDLKISAVLVGFYIAVVQVSGMVATRLLAPPRAAWPPTPGPPRASPRPPRGRPACRVCPPASACGP